MSEREEPLGRRPPTDDRHERRYPLTAATIPRTPTPVVLGINWYSGFDHPVRDSLGISWLPITNLGYVRGGHAICVRPDALVDRWYPRYDQGVEGACVGFSISRMQSLRNRQYYDGFSLYHAAQLVDEWDDTPPMDGTSVRAGCDVARKQGLWHVHAGRVALSPDPAAGIDENRWAGSVEEICACLSPSDNGESVLNRGWIRLVNSWGTRYPREVRMDLEVVQRLVFVEHGECVVVTDKA